MQLPCGDALVAALFSIPKEGPHEKSSQARACQCRLVLPLLALRLRWRRERGRRQGGDQKTLGVLAEQYPELGARWLRDPDGALARKLGGVGTPALLGVRQARVAWHRVGLGDRELLETTLRGWLGH
jgi:hypothetical protein